MKNKPLVIYHGIDADGMCSAWIIRQWFRKHNIECDFFPTNYGEPLPKFLNYSEIYIADFSYPRDVTKKIALGCGKLVILDHHRTAQEELEGLEEELRSEGQDVTIVFDMSRAGCLITWDYFSSKKGVIFDTPVIGDPPIFVKYCNDYDLWKFSLPNSTEITAAINSFPLTWEAWDYLSQMTEEELLTEGKAIARYRKKMIDFHTSQATLKVVSGHKIPVVNCSAKTIVSDLGNHLAKDHPFSVSWSQDGNGLYTYSFRSIIGDDNPLGIDVSTIAKQWGGGGHRLSAGARTKVWICE